MPKTQVKNQDSIKFQESKIHLHKIKEIKKIQVKIQEKTQDMQEPQEIHQAKYKKNFS